MAQEGEETGQNQDLQVLKMGIKMSLGENIRRLREEAGLKIGELAELSHTVRKTLERIETGKSDPQVGTLKPIIIALGCTADQAIFDDDEMGPDADLVVLFQQLRQFQGQDREMAKSMLKALIMQRHNKELLKQA